MYYRLVYIYGKRGRRGRDRMVVVCEFESRSVRGLQHYVIRFVSDLRQVRGVLLILRFPPPI